MKAPSLSARLRNLLVWFFERAMHRWEGTAIGTPAQNAVQGREHAGMNLPTTKKFCCTRQCTRQRPQCCILSQAYFLFDSWRVHVYVCVCVCVLHPYVSCVRPCCGRCFSARRSHAMNQADRPRKTSNLSFKLSSLKGLSLCARGLTLEDDMTSISVFRHRRCRRVL